MLLATASIGRKLLVSFLVMVAVGPLVRID